MYKEPLFLAAGDQALTIELGNAISPETNRMVHSLVTLMVQRQIRGIIDLTPSYRSILAQYDPIQISLDELQTLISELVRELDDQPPHNPTITHIPTLYGGKHGPDLAYVAKQAGITCKEAINIHSDQSYLIYMIGFTPGFPYLGGLCEKLTTPRLKTPRLKIPAGSVGIAESQTGIYPVDSPGGWRLVGQTPIRLFDHGCEQPSLLTPGNYVKFNAIPDESEYTHLVNLITQGKYDITVEEMK